MLNYLGDTLPRVYCDSTAFISTDYQLQDDPWVTGQQRQIRQFATQTIQKKVSSKTSKKELEIALNLEKASMVDEAIMQYKKMVNEDLLTDLALSKITDLSLKNDKKDITSYLVNLSKTDKSHQLVINRLCADIAIRNENYDEAMVFYDKNIALSPESNDAINAKLDKLNLYLHAKKDKIAATRLLTELKTLNIDDPQLSAKLKMADYFANKRVMAKLSEKKLTTVVESSNKVREFSLSNNYPNPFNPTTTISYDLPQDGCVSIKIYDALGREVRTLVNEAKEKGSYKAYFNASSLPSGLYFYTMKAGNYTSTKKMMLVK